MQPPGTSEHAYSHAYVYAIKVSCTQSNTLSYFAQLQFNSLSDFLCGIAATTLIVQQLSCLTCSALTCWISSFLKLRLLGSLSLSSYQALSSGWEKHQAAMEVEHIICLTVLSQDSCNSTHVHYFIGCLIAKTSAAGG